LALLAAAAAVEVSDVPVAAAVVRDNGNGGGNGGGGRRRRRRRYRNLIFPRRCLQRSFSFFNALSFSPFFADACLNLSLNLSANAFSR